ncbi:MAG: DNA polymerase III subunit gamma/tau [Selenomonadaceae bacterium]|nr:DNA polymerase III subunit gamma/tau [Selenomonadaceae bacterium]
MYTRVRPKNLAQLIGQEHITTALTRAISNSRLSHAYLLVGTRGTGKTSTARILAKAMNCEKVLQAQKEGRPLNATEIPCGKCPSCLGINSSPDNVEFDAASNRSVEDVSRLLSTANLAPLQSRVKTFIIDEVHMLSFEAVNSILKLIEEPPPHVAFFLATTEFNKVPQTIRSRCQILNFHLIPNEMIASYLQKLSKSLNVELTKEAARKFARLAAGSMRDAVTYFDQCYAMADKVISLEDVEKTLGLVSDADLDEIISAVKDENRTALSAALSRVFRSGLSAVSIAEALIGRLRDVEYNHLKRHIDSELAMLENFSEEIRKVIGEMQYSGIPDIILEMALMKIAAPKISMLTENTSSANTKRTESLDDIKKIFYELRGKLPDNEKNLRAMLSEAAVLKFSNDVVTIGFTSQSLSNMFNDDRRERFEEYISRKINRKIKIEKVVSQKGEGYADYQDIDEREKRNIQTAMDLFQIN